MPPRAGRAWSSRPLKPPSRFGRESRFGRSPNDGLSPRAGRAWSSRPLKPPSRFGRESRFGRSSRRSSRRGRSSRFGRSSRLAKPSRFGRLPPSGRPLPAGRACRRSPSAGLPAGRPRPTVGRSSRRSSRRSGRPRPPAGRSSRLGRSLRPRAPCGGRRRPRDAPPPALKSVTGVPSSSNSSTRGPTAAIMAPSLFRSSGAQNEIAKPPRPARPVRPIRCT